MAWWSEKQTRPVRPFVRPTCCEFPPGGSVLSRQPLPAREGGYHRHACSLHLHKEKRWTCETPLSAHVYQWTLLVHVMMMKCLFMTRLWNVSVQRLSKTVVDKTRWSGTSAFSSWGVSSLSLMDLTFPYSLTSDHLSSSMNTREKAEHPRLKTKLLLATCF